MEWLEAAVDYLPNWDAVTQWIPDEPPEWVIDYVEENWPELPKFRFSSLYSGLPHIYVQQDVCEKAFDVGVLILTLGTLLLVVLLCRRWLLSDRRKQKKANLCDLCQAEKSEVLSEDLVVVEKRVELIKLVCQNISKKLQGCLQGQGLDGTSQEKRLKKLPQMLLSTSLTELGTTIGDQSVYGFIYGICGNTQKLLGNELLEYEMEVEKMVINKQMEILENDIPSIAKQRKHLNKLTLDMDSAKARYQTATRHSVQASGSSATKIDVIKDEMEDASLKVEQCRDALTAEMFALVARESELAQHLMSLVKAQANYHKKALDILDHYSNYMEVEIKKLGGQPAYGCPLEDHLQGRQIASPIESCICFLLEYAIDEEGLFRIAGSASKVKKLKAAFDANMVDVIDIDYSRDPHAVAGVLKSYFRELPNPLMTHELYEDWMQAARISDNNDKLQALWTVVHKLPEPYFNNLRYVIKFLSKLASHQDVNKMSTQNLAIVIAPNLIWSPNDDTGTIGINMSLANTYSLIVDQLILNADWFFPGEVEFQLTSPGPNNLCDSLNSVASHCHLKSEGEVISPNGDVDYPSSILQGDSTHSSPQSGGSPKAGSPKSLRRFKKLPAPRVPPVSKEKPALPVKPGSERIDRSISNVYEFSSRPSHISSSSSSSDQSKKPVERKLSTGEQTNSSKSLLLNHAEKGSGGSNSMNLVNAEKPIIPEKPSVEKSPFLTNDNQSACLGAMDKQFALEESRPQVSVEKPPPPPPSPQVPRDICPPSSQLGSSQSSDVEEKSIAKSDIFLSPDTALEDELAQVTYRPRSPISKADSFDYYRPDWYGTEEPPPSPTLPPPAIPESQKLTHSPISSRRASGSSVGVASKASDYPASPEGPLSSAASSSVITDSMQSGLDGSLDRSIDYDINKDVSTTERLARFERYRSNSDALQPPSVRQERSASPERSSRPSRVVSPERPPRPSRPASLERPGRPDKPKSPMCQPPEKPERKDRTYDPTSAYESLPRCHSRAGSDGGGRNNILPWDEGGKALKESRKPPERPAPPSIMSSESFRGSRLGMERPTSMVFDSCSSRGSSIGPGADRPERPEKPRFPGGKYEPSHAPGRPEAEDRFQAQISNSAIRQVSSRCSPEPMPVISAEALQGATLTVTSFDRTGANLPQSLKMQVQVPSSPGGPRRPPRSQPPPPPPPYKNRNNSASEDTQFSFQ